MSEFLRLHKLPLEVRKNISEYLRWCDVQVLCYRPEVHGPHPLWMPLMTVGEFLKSSGIMKMMMLDRSIEEFIRFELQLVSRFTPYYKLNTTSVWIGRTVIGLVELHDHLICLEPDNLIRVMEVFTPSRCGKWGYPPHVNRILQRWPKMIVVRPLAPPPDGREVELRSLTARKIETVPLLQAIIRGHWSRKKKKYLGPWKPSFSEVPRSPGERHI